MKAKIISMGEIVEVAWIAGWRDDRSVFNASPSDIEIIDNKSIDWEQRRYEIAKDIVCANNIDLGNPELDFRLAIKYADKLIKQLKSNQS